MKPNIIIKLFDAVDVSRDVFNYLGRKPDRMFTDVMRQTLRPEIHTVRELGASVRHPAQTTCRDACLEPRLVPPLEIRGDDFALALIPGLIHEVARIRPVALGLATPIPDEADTHYWSIANPQTGRTIERFDCSVLAAALPSGGL